MSLLSTDFFSIRQIEQGDPCLFHLQLNPAHDVFKGHFPGNPVVPGVCMTQMIKECIQEWKGLNLQLETGDNLKFTAVLNPELMDHPTLRIALKEKESGKLHADANLFYEENSYFSFKGSFRIC